MSNDTDKFSKCIESIAQELSWIEKHMGKFAMGICKDEGAMRYVMSRALREHGLDVTDDNVSKCSILVAQGLVNGLVKGLEENHRRN